MIADIEMGFKFSLSLELFLRPRSKDCAQNLHFFRVYGQPFQTKLSFDPTSLVDWLFFVREVEEGVG
jgi:fructose 1,6-bisphosphatase